MESRVQRSTMDDRLPLLCHKSSSVERIIIQIIFDSWKLTISMLWSKDRTLFYKPFLAQSGHNQPLIFPYKVTVDFSSQDFCKWSLY